MALHCFFLVVIIQSAASLVTAQLPTNVPIGADSKGTEKPYKDNIVLRERKRNVPWQFQAAFERMNRHALSNRDMGYADPTMPYSLRYEIQDLEPEEFKRANWDAGDYTIRDFKPRRLGLQTGRVPAVNPRGLVHWALVSCNARPLWARTLTTTLLSAFANGLPAATITIVWCKHYNEADLKSNSILSNMRYSRNINVMFVPDNYPVDTGLHAAVAAQLTATTLPEYYSLPDIPLLVTEDDVGFAPDMGMRLSRVLRAAHTTALHKPFLLNLYMPGGDVAHADEIMDEYNTRAWRDAPQGITVNEHSFSYGSQAVVFSPIMTKHMAKYLRRVMETEGPGKLMDMNIAFLVRDFFNCSNSMATIPERPCVLFGTSPSLVQHMGSVSSLFQGNNTNRRNPRFHVSWNFPVPLAMAVDDPEGAW